MDQEIVAAIPSSRTPFTAGVLIPGVSEGRVHGPGRRRLGRPGSGVARSQRQPHGRPAHDGQRRGAQLDDRRRVGRRRGAERHRDAEFAIDVSAVDAQAATGGVRINFIPRDGGNRFSGTIFGSYASEGFAGDNFTGTDVQTRGLTRARQDQGERRLQSRVRRADRPRQALVLPLGALSLRGQLRRGHVLQRRTRTS